jgi:hypothetical protein
LGLIGFPINGNLLRIFQDAPSADQIHAVFLEERPHASPNILAHPIFSLDDGCQIPALQGGFEAEFFGVFNPVFEIGGARPDLVRMPIRSGLRA